MKIDKNTKTPLYTPGETPQKLRDFAYVQVAKSRDYLDNFDSIKTCREIDDKFEVAYSKGNKTTYRFK